MNLEAKPRNAQRDLRLGVVLFQTGEPETPEGVEPFLFNLFCDSEALDLPFSRLARERTASLLASRRAPRVRAQYQTVGGKSPLAELTERQARALESELSTRVNSKVVVAMRYCDPSAEAAARELLAFHPQEVVLLPLFPQ